MRLLLAGFLLCSSLIAQTGNGSLQGSVRDSSAAVIPGAKVGVEQLATKRQYTGASSGEGLYFFPSLPPGQYQISVEFPGLKVWKGNVTLQAGQNAVVDVTLRIADTSTEIVVTADVSPLLTTTQATIANVVERERIEQLPLNGRSFVTLIAQTTPGVEGDR